MFNNVIAKIEKITLFISGFFIVIMMLLISLDVLFRSILSISIPGSYEMTERYLMPLVFFPIFFYVYKSNSLPNLEFFVQNFNVKIRQFVQIVLLITELIVFVLLTIAGWQKAVEATQELLSFPAAGNMFPLYPFLYLVPIGFSLLIIGVILKLINIVKPQS